MSASELRADPPRDLTIPRPDGATARRVLSAWLADLVASLGRLPLAHASPDVREAATRALRALSELLRREPAPVLAALRRTTVSVHLRVATALGASPRTSDVDRLLVAALANLFGELAASGAAFTPVSFPRPPARVLLRGAGIAIDVPPGARELGFSPGAIAIEERRVDLAAPGAAVARPWIPLDDTTALALADDNPLALEEAHPDKEGNALSLGGRDASEWVASLRDALDRIARHLPELRAELALALGQIVPVGYEPEKHLSASYREAIGTIYLTLHPDPMTMTEAVVHEFQHNKLNAIAAIDPLLENAFAPLFASPVRPDPRPLHGVLLAVHAFLPNALLYARMRDAGDPLAATPRFAERHREIVGGNRAGLDVLLAHARPTPIGRALLEEMRELQARSESDLAAAIVTA